MPWLGGAQDSECQGQICLGKFMEGDPEKGIWSLIHLFIGLFVRVSSHSFGHYFLRETYLGISPTGHTFPCSTAQATMSAFQRLLDGLCPALNPL